MMLLFLVISVRTPPNSILYFQVYMWSPWPTRPIGLSNPAVISSHLFAQDSNCFKGIASISLNRQAMGIFWQTSLRLNTCADVLKYFLILEVQIYFLLSGDQFSERQVVSTVFRTQFLYRHTLFVVLYLQTEGLWEPYLLEQVNQCAIF